MIRSIRRERLSTFIVVAISAGWSFSASAGGQKAAGASPGPSPRACGGGTPISIDGHCRSPVEAFVWCSEARSQKELNEEQRKKLAGEVSVQVKLVAKVGVAAVGEITNKLHKRFADTPESVLLKIVDSCYRLVKDDPVVTSLGPVVKKEKPVGGSPVAKADSPAPFTVVAMDFSPRRYPAIPPGASNGTAIRDALSREDYPVRLFLEPAYPNWNNLKAVEAYAPDVIILHLSAFQEQMENAPKDVVDEGNRQMRAFVSAIHRKLSRVRFLVYSRRWADVPQEQCTPAKVLGPLSDKGWPTLETEFRVLCLGAPAAPPNFNDLSTLLLLRARLDELRPMTVSAKPSRP